MTLSLKVNGLAVRTGRGRTLLQMNALSVPAGSMIGVRGPSGAGKSTLLYALAGLLDVVDGDVLWGDADLYAMSAEGRASFRAERMGMIFQDFLLFEELGAGGNAGISTMFRPASERAALRARSDGYLRGLGLDASAGRPASSYSGGERQRIAVARALANDASILLADEPTASLHREAADRLIDDLCGLVQETGRTLVAVSHDPVLIERMDRVLTIENGVVTKDTRRDPA